MIPEQACSGQKSGGRDCVLLAAVALTGGSGFSSPFSRRRLSKRSSFGGGGGKACSNGRNKFSASPFRPALKARTQNPCIPSTKKVVKECHRGSCFFLVIAAKVCAGSLSKFLHNGNRHVGIILYVFSGENINSDFIGHQWPDAARY